MHWCEMNCQITKNEFMQRTRPFTYNATLGKNKKYFEENNIIPVMTVT